MKEFTDWIARFVVVVTIALFLGLMLLGVLLMSAPQLVLRTGFLGLGLVCILCAAGLLIELLVSVREQRRYADK